MRTYPSVALALAVSLTAAGCGGGGAAATTPTVTSTTPTTITTTTTTIPPTPPSSLTGLAVEDESVRDRPVVAVKFDNVEGKATPQVGINAADVVYEITVEGGVTRFVALYQSSDAGPIGPIRSARGSEIGVLEELNRPLFVWHGANAVLARDVRSSSIVPRSIDDVPGLFYRQSGRPSPYNSFAVGTAEIRATAPDDSTGPEEPILTFAEDGEAPSSHAEPAESLDLSFPTAFSNRSSRGAAVRFDWDPETEEWRRFQANRPHVDGDGEQIAVENVIVRFTEAVDSGTRDQAGSVVPTAQVTGEGVAWVFSDGTVTTGTWSKPDAESRTTYRDESGDEILLTPGETWIAMPYAVGSSSFH